MGVLWAAVGSLFAAGYALKLLAFVLEKLGR